jgi:hypothetical protein
MLKIGALALVVAYCALALGAWYYEIPKIGCGQIRELGDGAASGAYYCHIIVIPR